MPDDVYRLPIPGQLWERIRDEFSIPALDQVRQRLSAVHEDPDSVMRQPVRVFIEDGTYCPGFQFHADLSLNLTVVGLFQRAMELRIPHNFALWMMAPCPALQGARPVDLRKRSQAPMLLAALERTLAGAAA
ncbi:hypothetical protein [Arthrobacter sp. Soil762]|uniref:hypothetical protein n=1 Tax=Arthrobacter sp. Soil762 TaxID=1736401 RepID=UPI0006FA6CF3|nr:hypothetical protein [Arthrobacter sp. Soil762]KRE72670.1 hypothetical protein ASG77_08365 [Arthrobacter sp. Soil762]